MSLPSVIAILKGIKDSEGTGILQEAYKVVMREPRVNPGREKRKDFTKGQIKLAMKRQGYRCSECGNDLPADMRKVHGDHIDPNLEHGLNSDQNCAATCDRCNLKKGSDSIGRHAKRSGRTYMQIIQATPPGQDGGGLDSDPPA